MVKILATLIVTAMANNVGSLFEAPDVRARLRLAPRTVAALGLYLPPSPHARPLRFFWCGDAKEGLAEHCQTWVMMGD